MHIAKRTEGLPGIDDYDWCGGDMDCLTDSCLCPPPHHRRYTRTCASASSAAVVAAVGWVAQFLPTADAG